MSGYPSPIHWQQPSSYPTISSTIAQTGQHDPHLNTTTLTSPRVHDIDHRQAQNSSYFSGDITMDDTSPSDQEFSPDSIAVAETPAIDLEHGSELLRFTKSNPFCHLYDSHYRPTTVSLSSQLVGKFCFTPNVLGTTNSSAPPIICYRRNLFAISGSITLPRNLEYVSLGNGDQGAIHSTELLLVATETIDNRPVKVLIVPNQASQTAHASPSETEPLPIPLTPLGIAPADADFVSLPIDWKRLRFRNSTANNGRRKELQQHYTLSVRVIATLHSGQRICIFEASSAPIVVRGRSPRSFLPKSNTGSVTSRKARSGTVESTYSLHKVNSEPIGSFAQLALPSPSHGIFQPASEPHRYTSENIAARSLSEGGHYNSPYIFSTGTGDDNNYFGQTQLGRPRGVGHQSPRVSPYSMDSYSSYCQQSSYKDFPPMLTTSSWEQDFDTIYQPLVFDELTLPSQPRIKKSSHESEKGKRRPFRLSLLKQ